MKKVSLSLQSFKIVIFILHFTVVQGLLAHESPKGNNGPYRFIENKGQWPKPVLFKADLPGGALFLEKNAFTYNLMDVSRFDHAHTGNEKDIKNPIKGHAYKIGFINSNPNAEIGGKIASDGKYNYYNGKDPSKWVSNAKAFQKVLYKNIYPQINLEIYSKEGNLKYDFIVNPKANVENIQMNYEGVDGICIKDGNLVIKTSLGDVIEKTPYAYQFELNKIINVPCKFKLTGKVVSFIFPEEYNKDLPLVIDPLLIFSTYSGSTADNFGYTATFDSKGFLYSGSTAFGIGYPFTEGAYQVAWAGGYGTDNSYGTDIAITKYDTSGKKLIYSTYLGGQFDELPHSLICNSNDELFIFGTTGSPDFPVTPFAYDTSFAGGEPSYLYGLGVYYHKGTDMFVAKLNNQGTALLNSTFIGGSSNDGLNHYSKDTVNFETTNSKDYALRYNYADEVRGEIEIDKEGNIYIGSCTRSKDFPIVGNSFQASYGGGDMDGCVVKFNSSLSDIIWSSFLGGDSTDAIYSVAVDLGNNIYVAGGTVSKNFTASEDVIGKTYFGGSADGFITLINPSGSQMIKSSFWGSPGYDQVYFVDLDWANNVYVLGQTTAKDNYYIKNALYGKPNSGQFITKFNPGLDTIVWSTAFGNGSGKPNISPTSFLVDVCKQIYLSGWGGSPNFYDFMRTREIPFNLETTPDAFKKISVDNNDFYLMVMAEDASKLTYGTFFGGDQSREHVDGGTSRFDRKGKIYQSVCAGCGANNDFPIKPNPGAWSPTNNSDNCNNGVFKFDFLLPAVIADFDAPLGCNNTPLQFNNTSLEQKRTNFKWDFGDNTTSTEKNPVHTYSKGGTYKVKLLVTDFESCNLLDSLTKTITVLSDTTRSLKDLYICPGEKGQIGSSTLYAPNVTYQWSPSQDLNNPNIPDPIANPSENTTYMLLISNGNCVDTIYHNVFIQNVTVDAGQDRIVCSTDSKDLPLKATSNVPASYIWSSDKFLSDTLNKDLSNPVLIVNPTEGVNYYYVQAKTSLKCSALDSVIITVSDIAQQISSNQYICLGDTIKLIAKNKNPLDTTDVIWKPQEKIIGPNNIQEITVSPKETTIYNVTTQNKFGCTRIENVTITVSPLGYERVEATTDKDTIYKGDQTQLHAFPQEGYNYHWTPSGSLSSANTPNPIAKPEVTTTYNLTISDPVLNSCRLEDSVTVYVLDFLCDEPLVFIPNAFTPNGDNNNDVLFVRGNVIAEFRLLVFNRWGEMIFETMNQDNGWDGTFKGEKVDPGVFVYYLEATCLNKQKYFKKGNVTLIR